MEPTASCEPFPISIDLPNTSRASAEVRERCRPGANAWGCPPTSRVGLERLDYTKGIPERLRGVDRLLETNPEWRGRLVFTQVAVPSRSHLDGYQ